MLKLRRRARARNTDPGTSHEAAESVTGMTRRQDALLQLFYAAAGSGGLTDQDVRKFYVGPIQSDSGLRTRRSELVRQGKLVDTGRREVLATGRKAIVWSIPE